MLQFFSIAFIILVARYFVIAGLFYWVAYVLKRDSWQQYKIQNKDPSPASIKNEIKWSIATFFIFASIAGFGSYLQEQGIAKLYFDISERGWGYFAISMILLLTVQDFYFYVVHRIMHIPSIYRRVHAVHHMSTNPTPFAAFSFHPLEALVEAGFLVALITIIPFHPLAIILFLTISFVYNCIGHLGYELMPAWWRSHWLLGNFNFSIYHNLHHSQNKHNYGLYTCIWDKLFGTLKHP